ncbi:MAG: hypothetical protein P8176_05065 [Gammaproteobacteria bacterium]
MTSPNNALRFRSGIEGVLPHQFRPDRPEFVPTDRQVRLEGGRVLRYVDQYFDSQSRADLILEFARPSVSTKVTMPAEFRRILLATRMKMSNQRNRTRDIRKRTAVTRALQVLEELDANMNTFMESASSLQKA